MSLSPSPVGSRVRRHVAQWIFGSDYSQLTFRPSKWSQPALCLCTLLHPLVSGPFFFHIKASGMYPSQNAACVTLTTFSHVLVSVSFSLAADLNHSLRCSAFIPNGPPALPDQSFLTAAAIPLTSGGPSAILTGCTRIGSVSPFGGRYM